MHVKIRNIEDHEFLQAVFSYVPIAQPHNVCIGNCWMYLSIWIKWDTGSSDLSTLNSSVGRFRIECKHE